MEMLLVHLSAWFSRNRIVSVAQVKPFERVQMMSRRRLRAWNASDPDYHRNDHCIAYICLLVLSVTIVFIGSCHAGILGMLGSKKAHFEVLRHGKHMTSFAQQPMHLHVCSKDAASCSTGQNERQEGFAQI